MAEIAEEALCVKIRRIALSLLLLLLLLLLLKNYIDLCHIFPGLASRLRQGRCSLLLSWTYLPSTFSITKMQTNKRKDNQYH